MTSVDLANDPNQHYRLGAAPAAVSYYRSIGLLGR
jgi:hypothetical protein